MPRKMSSKEKKSDVSETRTRTWTFVLYEDSAPENWRQIIDELHVEWVESPWHDKDINAKEGSKIMEDKYYENKSFDIPPNIPHTNLLFPMHIF